MILTYARVDLTDDQKWRDEGSFCADFLRSEFRGCSLRNIALPEKVLTGEACR